MADDIKFVYENPDLNDFIAHIGTPHVGMTPHSGRYKYGSGDKPNQHSTDFLTRIDKLRAKGCSDTDIAKSLGLTTTQFRTQRALAISEQRAQLYSKVKALKDHGYANTTIADKLGLAGESTVRSILKEDRAQRMNQAKTTADFLMKEADKKGIIDVGKGVHSTLNISKEKMKEALYIAELAGYNVYNGRIPQVTNPGKMTTITALTRPEIPHKDIYEPGKIKSVKDYITRDDGETFEKKFHYPKSLDSKRLEICYAEDGGIKKDGVIELRRGCKDLDLGDSHYAQVRILVDDKKYLKGMAVYADDLPKGIDVRFNTNKTKDVAKLDVLKDIKPDKDNPFGASVKPIDEGGQYFYKDMNGKKQLGLINKCRMEGDWGDWNKSVPSQFLSKQPVATAKKQLQKTIKQEQEEFDSIMAVNNPTVRKRLLMDFASNCEAKAKNLSAAAFPRQMYQVILPLNSIKDNEIYAPNYKQGEKVALVRYPHGGLFEIPILTVNNKNKEGQKVMSLNAKDAVGINSKVAERLSGADFDGDTVMVIPTGKTVKIKNKDPLKGLEGFDPKLSYSTIEKDGKAYDAHGNEVSLMNKKCVGKQMGVVTNLINDMTIKGATDDEITRAVRHSMVVIDAYKHKLNYKQSEIDNGIASLKKKYQEGGASTIISRAKNEDSIVKTKGSGHINEKGKSWYDPSRPEGVMVYNKMSDSELYYPEHKTIKGKTPKDTIRTYSTVDGKKVSYSLADKKSAAKYEAVLSKDEYGNPVYKSKDGKYTYKTNYRKEKTAKMDKVDDAMQLVSKEKKPIEILYANFANNLKGMARDARLTAANTGKITYSKAAKEKYSDVVDDINKQLKMAEMNKPKERQAQAIANDRVKALQLSNPDMSKDDVKKYANRELNSAREAVGAVSTKVKLTPKHWEAIQEGAISESLLSSVLDNADMDLVRELATPRKNQIVTAAKENRIRAMISRGLTASQIAEQLGVSVSTVNKYKMA